MREKVVRNNLAGNTKTRIKICGSLKGLFTRVISHIVIVILVYAINP